MCQFPSCNFFYQDGSISVPFINVRAGGITGLGENYKVRFSKVRIHGTNILGVDKPFSIEVRDTPENCTLN
jgi:hypothetical protein